MKAPAFWYKPPGFMAALLFPLSLFWQMGTGVRRWLATPYRAKKPVICVGNLVAGGAGKTPSALAIALVLQQAGKSPVFVTRGYGGEMQGPIQVDPGRHSARDVGDEALLLACVAPTFIGRDRAAAIMEAEKHGSHIVLDDGLQNPHILSDLGFLVIDGEAGLGNGYVIPAGPLRETLTMAMTRVTAVIIVGGRDDHRIKERMQCPMIRTEWHPDLPDDFPRGDIFFAFAGIGRPQKFYATCSTAGLTLAGTMDFPDHHIFSDSDLTKLRGDAEACGARLLTTEKDYVRLPHDFRKTVTVFSARLEFDDAAAIKRLLRI